MSMPALKRIPFVKPRAGRGTSHLDVWTGSLGVDGQHAIQPKLMNTRQLIDFEAAAEIKDKCVSRLQPEWQLGQSKSESNISLRCWVEAVKKKIEDCGMDSVLGSSTMTEKVSATFWMIGSMLTKKSLKNGRLH